MDPERFWSGPGQNPGGTLRDLWDCAEFAELVRKVLDLRRSKAVCTGRFYVGQPGFYRTSSDPWFLFPPADFILWLDSSGRVLPIRSGPCVPPPCIAVTVKPGAGPVTTETAVEDGSEPPAAAAEGGGGATEDRPFRAHRMCSIGGAPAPAEEPRAGTNGGALDYGPYFIPAAQYYSGLAKEQSVESQDSSTLSSPPSDGLAPPQAPPGALAPDSLFQFSIGKILEDEGPAAAPEVQQTDCEAAGFGAERGAAPDEAGPEGPRPEQRQIRRSVSPR